MVTLKRLSSLMDHPVLYRWWQAPFVRAKFAPILRHNDLSAVRRVLDVGCGPGTNATAFRGLDYVGLDHNPQYIETARRHHGGRFLVADACSFAELVREQFDFVLLNSLLHHIAADDVRRILRQVHDRLAPDGHVHILDLILPGQSGAARFLARADRGDYPRPLCEWRELFCEAFSEVVCQPYAVRCCGITLWNMVYFKGRRQS